MKLIKISTDLELSVHEFPEGTHEEQNQFLQELIGNNCCIYEHVRPVRLYREWNITARPDIPGQCVSMLVDEEGRYKPNAENPVGSYLYGADEHGQPIMGNILFVGEERGRNGIDFCGIEDNTFEMLEWKLDSLIYAMKKEAKESGTYGN